MRPAVPSARPSRPVCRHSGSEVLINVQAHFSPEPLESQAEPSIPSQVNHPFRLASLPSRPSTSPSASTVCWGWLLLCSAPSACWPVRCSLRSGYCTHDGRTEHRVFTFQYHVLRTTVQIGRHRRDMPVQRLTSSGGAPLVALGPWPLRRRSPVQTLPRPCVCAACCAVPCCAVPLGSSCGLSRRALCACPLLPPHLISSHLICHREACWDGTVLCCTNTQCTSGV